MLIFSVLPGQSGPQRLTGCAFHAHQRIHFRIRFEDGVIFFYDPKSIVLIVLHTGHLQIRICRKHIAHSVIALFQIRIILRAGQYGDRSLSARDFRHGLSHFLSCGIIVCTHIEMVKTAIHIRIDQDNQNALPLCFPQSLQILFVLYSLHDQGIHLCRCFLTDQLCHLWNIIIHTGQYDFYIHTVLRSACNDPFPRLCPVSIIVMGQHCRNPDPVRAAGICLPPPKPEHSCSHWRQSYQSRRKPTPQLSFHTSIAPFLSIIGFPGYRCQNSPVSSFLHIS